jgi:hypothetical protein
MLAQVNLFWKSVSLRGLGYQAQLPCRICISDWKSEIPTEMCAVNRTHGENDSCVASLFHVLSQSGRPF